MVPLKHRRLCQKERWGSHGLLLFWLEDTAGTHAGSTVDPFSCSTVKNSDEATTENRRNMLGSFVSHDKPKTEPEVEGEEENGACAQRLVSALRARAKRTPWKME